MCVCARARAQSPPPMTLEGVSPADVALNGDKPPEEASKDPDAFSALTLLSFATSALHQRRRGPLLI